MIKDQISKIYYCQNCGWSISNKVLENLMGVNDSIYFCEKCRAKLIVNNIKFIDDYFYTVQDFFFDIKKEISQIAGRKLSFFQISLYYLDKKNIWYINDRIRRSKADPDYYLNTSMLNSYENALRSKLGHGFKKLKKKFEKYRFFNLLEHKKRDYTKYTKDYFKKIDTKEKMYWFCWILAEGSFTKKALRISINPKDGILLKWFVEDLGLEPHWVRFDHAFHKKTRKYTRALIIEISNKEFVENLRSGAKELYPQHMIYRNFLKGKKSDKIRFPRYASKDFLKAGLLGFFDGDGTHSGETPRIGTICEDFLWDIVEIFNLPIYIKPKPHYSHGKIVKYYLDIDAELFVGLLENYERSLPRKRVNYWRFCNKFLFTKDQLQKIVDNNPGISGQGIADKHLELTGVRIGRRTALQKMKEWNIKKRSKEDYFWQRTIELCREDWSLKRIWVEEL